MTPQAAEAAARAYLDLEAREQAAASQVWARELEAQRYEDEILRWWGQLNAASNAWEALSQIPFNHVATPKIQWAVPYPDGSQAGILSSPPGLTEGLATGDWKVQLQSWAAAGWTVVRTRWALVGHQAAAGGAPARSTLQAGAFLQNDRTRERLSVDVQATLVWKSATTVLPELDRVEGVTGRAVRRTGNPPFRLELDTHIPTHRSIFTDPLLSWDLDEDGLPELALVGADLVYRRRAGESGTGVWTSNVWLDLPAERVVAALHADANGDGQDDLVTLGASGVRWWPGVAGQGPVRGSARDGWQASVPLKHPQSLTAGDIDGDGDLDLWGTQYKLPYQGGQFPTPWDDANDGFPSYLLLNDGEGRFSDGTVAAGLDAKRFRRSYSASFIDLDNDGDLDLVNVSDFAGLDLYLNDGRGRFTDISDRLDAARHAFGMSHAIADLNRDGLPDLLMLGMTSTVADRLGVLGLERGGRDRERMREMTVGNRLFFGRGGGVPLAPAPVEWESAVARTGWTWGAAWVDLDLDGRLDLAVANGHETRAGVRDYERQFWLHDRFVGTSSNDPAVDFYFRTAAGRRQADQASYGGWQNNVVLYDPGRFPWPDLSWVWGLALPEDCRNLLATDVDGDGRPDLVITTFEEWPIRRQRLLVFRNELPGGNWVGLRWKGPFPSGGVVRWEGTEGVRSHWFLTGDGYRSQGDAAVVFAAPGALEGFLTVTRPAKTPARTPVEGSGRWLKLGPGQP